MKTENRDTLENLYQKEINFIDDCKYRIHKKVLSCENHQLTINGTTFSVKDDTLYINGQELLNACDFEQIAYWTDVIEDSIK